jgi:hypothetical protein
MWACVIGAGCLIMTAPANPAEFFTLKFMPAIATPAPLPFSDLQPFAEAIQNRLPR